MLKRFNVTIPSDYEEQLLGLAERLGLNAFSSPIICDTGKGETDFEYTGKTVVSFIVSTVEQNVNLVEAELDQWFKDFSLDHTGLSIQEYSENQDWMENFKEHFKPIIVGKSIVIRPPWVEPLSCETPETTTILIDPGMAFGTGTHETTRLCLEFLESINCSGQFCLDLGAGSGILSFYLMKKGAEAVVAIEIEGTAIENMKKNAALNGISDRLTMVCTDLGKYKPTVLADGLAANLTSPVILEYLPVFSPWVKKGGWGVFSGVNSANAPAVKQAFLENGWSGLQEKTEGDWHGFYLVKD
ncbi:MAG: hypothetical protein Kow0029_28970 [Candidatus Rifleibacteriota bacterium]